MNKKKERQDLIIEGARKVFLEKGLFNTVMEDIAEEVGLTRRTLYRYFQSKEELAYQVTMVLLNDWNQYQTKIYKDLEGRGIKKLDCFLNNLVDYMTDKLDLMTYLGEFDFYFKDELGLGLGPESSREFNQLSLESDLFLQKLMKEGQKDGSISLDLDLDLTVATISNILWSFGQRIAIRNEIMLKEYGYRGLELIKHQITIYINAIRRR